MPDREVRPTFRAVLRVSCLAVSSLLYWFESAVEVRGRMRSIRRRACSRLLRWSFERFFDRPIFDRREAVGRSTRRGRRVNRQDNFAVAAALGVARCRPSVSGGKSSSRASPSCRSTTTRFDKYGAGECCRAIVRRRTSWSEGAKNGRSDLLVAKNIFSKMIHQCDQFFPAVSQGGNSIVTTFKRKYEVVAKAAVSYHLFAGSVGPPRSPPLPLIEFYCADASDFWFFFEHPQ